MAVYEEKKAKFLPKTLDEDNIESHNSDWFTKDAPIAGEEFP